jgi:hypothetical protein
MYGDSILGQDAGFGFGGEPCCEPVVQACKEAFAEFKLDPVILAINGDPSGTLMWRLQNGEWPQQPPKVALVHIGNNDMSNAWVRHSRCCCYRHTVASEHASVLTIAHVRCSVSWT